MPPADLKGAAIIRADAIRDRPPAARWRPPLLGSLLAHALLGTLGWWVLWHDSDAESPEREPFTTLVKDDEEDRAVGVLDVDVRLPPARPVVVGAPPSLIPAAEIIPQEPAAPARAALAGAAGSPEKPSGAPAAQATAATPNGPGTGTASGAATTFFNVPARGQSVVYVIDRSASMGPGGRLDLARREVLASLARLPATARFQIVAYNKHVETVRVNGRGGLLPATEDNKRLAALFLQALAAEGSTDHWPGLSQAMLLAPDVVYFLTDADDLKAEQVRALTELNKGRASIHAIELNTANRDRHELPMHALPKLNRGQYQAVDVLRLQ